MLRECALATPGGGGRTALAPARLHRTGAGGERTDCVALHRVTARLGQRMARLRMHGVMVLAERLARGGVPATEGPYDRDLRCAS